MPQFKSSRMTDNTAISAVDDAVGVSEQAHATILGIPVNTEITGSIFGSVDSSARITGKPKIYNTTGNESEAACVDFVDEPEDVSHRVVPLAGGLWVYKRSGAPNGASNNAGVAIQDLGLERLLINLDDVSITDLDDEGGNLLGVDNVTKKIIGVTPAVAGSPTFIEGADTPPDYGGADGMVPVVVETGGGFGYLAFQPITGGGAGNFIDLGDTLSTLVGTPPGYSDSKKGAVIAVTDDGNTETLIASFPWHARASTSTSQVLSLSSEVRFIHFGSINSEYPASGNLIQTETNGGAYNSTLIIAPRDIYRDAIYQINYQVHFSELSFIDNHIEISVASSGLGGISCAEHYNYHKGLADFGGSGAVTNGSHGTMHGSFIARVPQSSSSDCAIRFYFARIGANNVRITTGTELKIQGANIDITRIS